MHLVVDALTRVRSYSDRGSLNPKTLSGKSGKVMLHNAVCFRFLIDVQRGVYTRSVSFWKPKEKGAGRDFQGTRKHTRASGHTRKREETYTHAHTHTHAHKHTHTHTRTHTVKGGEGARGEGGSGV